LAQEFASGSCSNINADSLLIFLVDTGTVFFIIRWWDPITFAHHAVDDTGPWPAWPLLESDQQLWTWLFAVPLAAYFVWQFLYLLVVNVLRRQRLLNDPEVMTSFRSILTSKLITSVLSDL
jgi:hypothetical protein